MVRIPTHGPPTHPGEMLLEEFLKPLDLSQTALAEELGVSYPRINELVRGRRGVTPDTALRLERLFGMEAQFWLNLQVAWDLYQAQHSLPAWRSACAVRRARTGCSAGTRHPRSRQQRGFTDCRSPWVVRTSRPDPLSLQEGGPVRPRPRGGGRPDFGFAGEPGQIG